MSSPCHGRGRRQRKVSHRIRHDTRPTLPRSTGMEPGSSDRPSLQRHCTCNGGASSWSWVSRIQCQLSRLQHCRISRNRACEWRAGLSDTDGRHQRNWLRIWQCSVAWFALTNSRKQAPCSWSCRKTTSGFAMHPPESAPFKIQLTEALFEYGPLFVLSTVA